MKNTEVLHLIIAVAVLAIVISFRDLFELNFSIVGQAILFAFIIIVVNVGAKKLMARALDADVEHSLWYWQRFGLKPNWRLRSAIPIGVILPIFVTAFSLGAAKIMTILTYETKALKRRAAKRFGYYSFTAMTEWHNGVVGAAGIIAILVLALITYWFAPLENLARFAAFYAFYNMIPFSKLDGTQIFFGSRILYYTLAIITLIFTAFALVII